jgi:hypothetical protein
VTALVTWLLTQPLMRTFLIELFMRLFAELISGSKADPAFRAQFFALTARLASAETEEEKRRVLDEIHALRAPRK